MSITYTIDRARRRLFTVAEGSVTFSDITAHLEKERNDNGLPFTELIDATRATVAFNTSDVRRIVDRLRNLGRNNALGPTAILTGDDVSYGIMRMLEMMVSDVCDVRPFRSRGKAEEWLNAIPMPRPPAQEG
jgi:hypothetical protein